MSRAKFVHFNNVILILSVGLNFLALVNHRKVIYLAFWSRQVYTVLTRISGEWSNSVAPRRDSAQHHWTSTELRKFHCFFGVRAGPHIVRVAQKFPYHLSKNLKVQSDRNWRHHLHTANSQYGKSIESQISSRILARLRTTSACKPIKANYVCAWLCLCATVCTSSRPSVTQQALLQSGLFWFQSYSHTCTLETLYTKGKTNCGLAHLQAF